MGKKKRIFTFVLSLLLLVSMLPVGALAEKLDEAAENAEAPLTELLTSENTEEQTSTEDESIETDAPVTEDAELMDPASVMFLQNEAEAAVVASGYCGDPNNEGGEESVTWVLTSDGTLTISGEGDMGYNPDIPQNQPWGEYITDIKSVIIEDGVTSIRPFAFDWFETITSIEIPDGVTSIGRFAFRDCHKLMNVTIPDSVTSIGPGAFKDCWSLKEITIPNSVTSIENDTFNKCGSLESIILPEKLTTIWIRAFENCSSLKAIKIPDGVTYIGYSAFAKCGSLVEISIPDSVTNIEEAAFFDCFSLKEITIPKNLTRINEATFEKCSKIKSVIIPNSVTTIEGNAFAKSGLLSIFIPASVTEINLTDFGYSPFYECSSSLVIYCEATRKPIGWNNDWRYGHSVVWIGNADEYAFWTNIDRTAEHITIPNGATMIPNCAFSGCTNLKSVTIPDSVTNIGDYAFAGCSSLINISIPQNVTSIGESSFEGCSSLTSTRIPISVTHIGNSAFDRCSALLDVYFSGTKDQWNEITIGTKNDPLLNATKYYEGVQPQYAATLTDTGRSLSLSDLVFINQYCTIESENLSSAYVCANGGLLVWSSQPQEASIANAQTNGYVQQGLVVSGSEYTQRTNGIIAKNYGDTFFMCIYLKMPDGSYLYTPLKEYGVVTYCNNKIASATASQTLKTMCQTMQAYGAAAKAYFG